MSGALSCGTRRAVMGAAAISALAASATGAERRLVPQARWRLPPDDAPGVEGMLDVGGARLWYWDTGGGGAPVILLHASTGSGAVWGYQRSAFAAAGLRVIGYSRRGHYRSEADPAAQSTSTGDLRRLVEHLGLGRFHLVGSALGGYTVVDYAISQPERLLSIVLASTMGGVQEPAYLAETAALTPEPWAKMPASFRELGPSYRAAFPQGVAAWEALERVSHAGPAISQGLENRITWGAVSAIRTPTLFLTGDADLYMPPSRARAFVARMPAARLVVAPEAGHSLYWEQPEAFNAEVLRFLGQRRQQQHGVVG